MWTKCIKSNLAVIAALAGPIPPSEITSKSIFTGVSKLNVFYTNNTIHTMLPSDLNEGIIAVYNFNGRLVYQKEITGTNKNSVEINSSGFANGVYHIRLVSRNGQASNKIAITQ